MNYVSEPSVLNEPALAVPSIRIPGWKRAIDLLFCLVTLPILALATLLVTIVMKFVSPGTVFFRQERIGYLGSRFRCYKFRTMHLNSDTGSHRSYCQNLIDTNAPMVKLDAGDKRVIPGGWLIRACGLDELPQIINVLRGEMSLVGPRPCVAYEYEKYAPWQKERFNTLPGLTGLWQVSGKNRTTFDEMMRLDIHYARHKSLWMDLRIIFMTVPALLVQVFDTRRARKSAHPFPARAANGTRLHIESSR